MLGSMEEQEYRQAHHRMEVVQVKINQTKLDLLVGCNRPLVT
jgi:hypothetical protein